MTSYRGGMKLPQDLDPKVRKALESHDRAIIEGIPTYDLGNNIVGTVPGGGPSTFPIKTSVYNSGGTLSNLPYSAEGVINVIRFNASPVVKSGTGNLVLSGDYYPQKDDTLTLIASQQKWYEVSRSAVGSGTIWIRPLTGDMTTLINLLIVIAPSGWVFNFAPGTYNFSDTLVMSKPLTFNGYGAVFDWGSTTLTDSFYGIPRTTLTTSAPTAREAATLSDGTGLYIGSNDGVDFFGSSINGIEFTRTRAGDASSDLLHCALRIEGVAEGVYRDLKMVNWELGVLPSGSNAGSGKGTVHCEFHNIRTRDCRYGITSYAYEDGWSNQNTFYGGRVQLTSAIRADGSYPNDYELLRLLEDTSATFSAPNNNQFFGTSFEHDANRKARIEGKNNAFYNCRWENSNTSTDISIGHTEKASSNWRWNQIIGGTDLDEIIGNETIEYLSSGTNLNNGNIIIGGGNAEFAGNPDGGQTRTDLSAFRFVHSGANTKPAIGVATTSATPVERLQIKASANSLNAGLEFFEDSPPTTLANSLALGTSTPFDLTTSAGFNIASRLRIRAGGTKGDHAHIQGIGSGGSAVFPGVNSATIPSLAIRQGTSSNPVFDVWNSSEAIRLRLIAEDSATPAGGTSIGWYTGAEASEVLSNSIYLESSGNDLRVTSGLHVIAGLSASDAETPTGTIELTADSSGGYIWSDHSQATLYLAGDGTTSEGLRLRDDGSSFVVETRNTGRDLLYNVRSGNEHNWQINYAEVMRVGASAAQISVPTTYKVNDASSNTILDTLTINRANSTSSTGLAAGGGAALHYVLESSTDNSFNTAGKIQMSWTDATYLSEDSRLQLYTKTNGSDTSSQNHLVLDGATSAVGIGRVPTTFSLEVQNGAHFNVGLGNFDFRVDGDTRNGVLFVDASTDCVVIDSIAASPPAGTSFYVSTSRGFQIDGASETLLVTRPTDDEIDIGGTLHMTGSRRLNYQEISSNTNHSLFDHFITMTTSSITYTLLDASTVGSGYVLEVKNASGGNCTIDGQSGDNIEGTTATTGVTIADGESFELVSDGSNTWRIH